MIDFSSDVVAGTVLIRDAIQSPNYVAGVSGWTINADGTSEFNDVTVRGELFVTDPDGSYVRIYDQDPGSGALIEFGLPTASGAVLTPGSITSTDSVAGSGEPGLVFVSATVDGTPTGVINLISNTTLDISEIDLAATDISLEVDGSAIHMLGANVNIELDPAGGNLNINSSNGATNIEGSLAVDGNVSFGSDLNVTGDIVAGGIGQELVADFAGGGVANVTPVNVTDGVITLAPNSNYKFELRTAYDTTTANDIAFNWTSSDLANVAATRYILGPALGTTTNIDTNMVFIRRSLGTRQGVGGPNGVASAFTGYWEDGYVSNSSGSPQTFQLQISQVVNGGTSTLQSGTIYARRIA